MFINIQINRNLLLIFILEIIVIMLAVFSIVPREAVLFLTGFLAFYFIFAPLKEVVILFIVSIPLFVALPITENFDTMSNWRILLLILFLRIFFAKFKNIRNWQEFVKNINNKKLYIYVFAFFVIAVLSLINAESAGYGIRKILFLVNAMMIFFIIINSGMGVKKIQLSVIASLLISLVIGYAQIIAVFFTPLYLFWQWWANNVISVFYGKNLADLLSYSNTWFSYYDKSSPTLRIFSVFPDSHSFALFSLIGLIPLTYFWTQRSVYKKLYISIGIFSLLSIILSGSRGFWASAILIAVILVLIFVIIKIKKYRQCIELKKYFIILLVFFMLFPVGSLILSGSRIGNIINGEKYEELTLKRIRSIFNLEETSNKGRLEIWNATLNSFVKHPFLGIGIGNYPVVIGEPLESGRRGASAHNLYFDIAAEMGIFGLIIFLLILWKIFQKAWTQITIASPIFIFYFLWILLYSLFDVVLLNDKVLLFFIIQTAILYLPRIIPENSAVLPLEKYGINITN
ncbi:MAG: O-antigen ligase family protein [Patescibacteria group bacterium]